MLDLTQEMHGRMLVSIMSKLGICEEEFEVLISLSLSLSLSLALSLSLFLSLSLSPGLLL
jgi:hypothetical protein